MVSRSRPVSESALSVPSCAPGCGAESASRRIMSSASASEKNAALTSPGTGTAWGLWSGAGVIWDRVEKKVERSGRRRRADGAVEGSVVLCSTRIVLALEVLVSFE